jgi:hypothetical protein
MISGSLIALGTAFQIIRFTLFDLIKRKNHRKTVKTCAIHYFFGYKTLFARFEHPLLSMLWTRCLQHIYMYRCKNNTICFKIFRKIDVFILSGFWLFATGCLRSCQHQQPMARSLVQVTSSKQTAAGS